MKTTTRRGAIATMAAAATVAVVPANATDDTNLTTDPVVALADECKGVLAEFVEAARTSHALYDETWAAAEDLYDQADRAEGGPQYVALCRGWHEEFDRQSEANGYGKAHAEWDRVGRRLRSSVARLVGTHATTLRGAIGKLEVMSAVNREHDDPETIDGHDGWLPIVIADLERLGGAA